MKRLLLAWIEQVLSFDSQVEAYLFLEKLKGKPYRSRVLWIRRDIKGTVFIRLRKAYNDSPFPEEEDFYDGICQ